MSEPGESMRALRYSPSVPRFLLARALRKRSPPWLPALTLARVEAPSPPPGWRRVDVRLAGLCGSDLSLLFATGSPRLSPFFSFPAVLGHEILGEVEGSRVAVDPVLACRERGLEACDACLAGDEQRCGNVAEGPMAPGIIGYNRDLPGGWSERVVAHERRLHEVPDDVPDDRAVLAEPFAVAWRAARLALDERSPGRVLVVGSGSIGLLTIVALRAAGFEGELHATARYPRQGEAARELGADRVHGRADDARAAAGGRSYEALIGPKAWRGGFDVVVDAAGSASSLDEAAWANREGGRLVLVGGTGHVGHDFSPHWFRELSLVGSYVYRPDEFAAAVALLADLPQLDALAPHRYPLERHLRALADVRGRRVAKAAFDPRA